MTADPLATILNGIPLAGLDPQAGPIPLCGAYVDRYLVSTKLIQARKIAGGDYGRPRMTDPQTRLKKLGIETGREHPVTGAILPPMEPWTCADPNGAIRLYAQIIRAPDGTFTLADFATPAKLDKIRYMQAEKLIVIEDGDTIVPLGDAIGEPGRTYPGAPVPDEWNERKKQLRTLADELIRDAYHELCAELDPRHDHGPGQIAITNRDIAYRANRIKGRLRALDEYRYLSVETVRRRIAGLLERGEMTELEPPRRVREGRTWKTLPRVYEIPPGIVRQPPRRRRGYRPPQGSPQAWRTERLSGLLSDSPCGTHPKYITWSHEERRTHPDSPGPQPRPPRHDPHPRRRAHQHRPGHHRARHLRDPHRDRMMPELTEAEAETLAAILGESMHQMARARDLHGNFPWQGADLINQTAEMSSAFYSLVPFGVFL